MYICTSRFRYMYIYVHQDLDIMFFIAFLYPLSPKGEGVYCFTSVPPSVLRPSKIFFVAFFSVTVDGRNLIFGHKHHIGIPYCR